MNSENRKELSCSNTSLNSEANDTLPQSPGIQSPGITIRVNDVSPEGEPFEVIPSFEAINEYLQPPEWLTRQLKEQLSVKEKEQTQLDLQSPEYAKLSSHIALRREQLSSSRIETCSRLSGQLCSGLSCHPLVNVIAAAYRQHRPIILSPDMIWLTICQGISHHVNQHPERFRAHFVEHTGAERLEVQHNGLFPGSPDNDWPSFVDDLTIECMKFLTTKARDLFTPQFSTTGRIERMAAQTVMLECVQDFFEYTLVRIICGIPTITLEGTADDWSALRQRVDQFDDLELNWWFDVLKPILDQFAAASRGDVDVAFWQSIYRQRDAICGMNMTMDANATGWFAALFPYLADRCGFITGPNPWLFDQEKRSLIEWMLYDRGEFKNREQQIRDSREMIKRRKAYDRGIYTNIEYRGLELQAFQDAGLPIYGLFERQFPSGVSRIRFHWKKVSPESVAVGQQAMEFLSGFMGIEQAADTLALRPYIGWAVRKASC